MSTPFDPSKGLVIVNGVIEGPKDRIVVRFALDTGATLTTVSAAHLLAAGYDPSATTDRVRITTGSGIEYVPRLPVSRLSVLEQSRLNVQVLSHTLPPTATVDGLLGLDFIRGQKLTIDFSSGLIELTYL